MPAERPRADARLKTISYDLQFQPDTEMIENVCEDKTRWIGRLSETERDAVPEVSVVPKISYVPALATTDPIQAVIPPTSVCEVDKCSER